jgi:hypothetical protein
MNAQQKYEKPFFLDMDFGEALERFARTDPKEVAGSEKSGDEIHLPQTTHSRRKPAGMSNKY